MLVIIVVIGTIMTLSVKLIFMAGLLIQQCCEPSSVSIGLCRCLDLEKKNSRVFWLHNDVCIDAETRRLAYSKQKNNHNPPVLSIEPRLSVQTLYPCIIHAFIRHWSFWTLLTRALWAKHTEWRETRMVVLRRCLKTILTDEGRFTHFVLENQCVL